MKKSGVFTENGIFEFQEVDLCGLHYGRINVASVNSEKGIILFLKENDIKAVDDYREFLYDDDSIEKDHKLAPIQRRMANFGWNYRNRKGQEHKPRRNNRKTMPDRKIQRGSRGLLGLLKTSCINDEDCFYNTASMFDSIFSQAAYFDFDEDMEVCA